MLCIYIYAFLSFFFFRLFNISNLLKIACTTYKLINFAFAACRVFSFRSSLSLHFYEKKIFVFFSFILLTSVDMHICVTYYVCLLFNCTTAMQQNNNYYLSRAENLKFTVHLSVCCVSFYIFFLFSICAVQMVIVVFKHVKDDFCHC